MEYKIGTVVNNRDLGIGRIVDLEHVASPKIGKRGMFVATVNFEKKGQHKLPVGWLQIIDTKCEVKS